jgi:hypothetical protein
MEDKTRHGVPAEDAHHGHELRRYLVQHYLPAMITGCGQAHDDAQPRKIAVLQAGQVDVN